MGVKRPLSPRSFMARAYNAIKHATAPLTSQDVADLLRIEPLCASAACKKLRENGAVLNIGCANGGSKGYHRAKWVLNPTGRPPSKRRAPRKKFVEPTERTWVPWYLDVEWPWNDNRWEMARTAEYFDPSPSIIVE